MTTLAPSTSPVPALPLVHGDWKPLSADELGLFEARLHHYEMMSGHEPPLNKQVRLQQAWALPLSFFPGWFLVQVECLVPHEAMGTLDVLMGPGFFWVIAHDAPTTLRSLCRGTLRRIAERPSADAPAEQALALAQDYFESPLDDLSDERQALDFAHFYSQAMRAEGGTFRLVTCADELRAVGVADVTDELAALVGPMEVRAAPDDHALGATFLIKLNMVYTGALFAAEVAVQPGGAIEMISDTTLREALCPPETLIGPLRNVHPLPGRPAIPRVHPADSSN